MSQCAAKSKRSGERCKRHASKGMAVCAVHGGKSLAGKNHPSFKHGRYSKYMPDRLAEQYLDALQDKDLISMNDEIALTDSRLAEMLNRLNGLTMVADGWASARRLYGSFRRHTNAGRQGLAIRALDDLGALLEQNQTDDVVWRDISELIEQRRRLVDTERKRLMDESNAIAIDQVMMLMAAVADIVRRHVASKEARGAIAGEIKRLVHGD